MNSTDQTLLAMFAAHAMQALVSRDLKSPDNSSDHVNWACVARIPSKESVSLKAYDFAEAMLAEHHKRALRPRPTVTEEKP